MATQSCGSLPPSKPPPLYTVSKAVAWDTPGDTCVASSLITPTTNLAAETCTSSMRWSPSTSLRLERQPDPKRLPRRGAKSPPKHPNPPHRNSESLKTEGEFDGQENWCIRFLMSLCDRFLIHLLVLRTLRRSQFFKV